MFDKPTIKMTIPRHGLADGSATVSVKTTGYAGGSCQAATKALEQTIGSRQSETLTDEYFKEGHEHQHLQGG